MAKRTPSTQSKGINPYMVMGICLGGLFIVGGVIIWLIKDKGFQGIVKGSGGIIFFLLLIPFALFNSGFLFSAFRTYAKLTGKYLDWKVDVGGPVAVFFLLLVGGIIYQQNWTSTASQRLRINFENQSGDSIHDKDGEVNIFLSTDDNPIVRKTHGEDWIEISAQGLGSGDTIEVRPNFKNYSSRRAKYIIPASGIINIRLGKLSIPRKLSGMVLDFDKRPVTDSKQVIVIWGNQQDTVKNGRYELTMDYAMMKQTFSLYVEGAKFYEGERSLPPDTTRTHDIPLSLYAKQF